MKKKIVLFLAVVSMLICALALTVSAKSAYLEPIPDELKAQNDTFTHFVVFEEQKYFVSSGSTISGLNTDVMIKDMDAEGSGIDKSKIGTEYLTRYNVPAYIGETLITYVNLNSMKTHQYFKNVCGYVQLEGTVNKVHDMNDCVQQLRCIDFGENSQVTNIPNSFARMAYKLASVKNFPRNLTYIGPQAFNNCYGAFRGELYINATTIDNTAFNNAISNVTHLILGPNVKSMGTQALTVVIGGEIPAFYAPADKKPALVSIEFQCDVSEITFAKQGNDSGSFYFPISSARTAYEKLESIILSHPNNAKYVTEDSIFNDFTAEGVNILFNDSDGLDDYVTAKHNFSILDDVSYESYTEEGKKAMKCADCGAITYKSAAPLFVCLGYSAPESEKLGIAIEYKVNKDAIKEYADATGKSFEYGVFAVSKTKLGDNAVFDNEGNATSGVISTELSSYKFSSVLLKITGFEEKHKTMEFALGVYTSFDGNYGYIQENATAVGNSYVFTTYNAIIDGISKKNEVA